LAFFKVFADIRGHNAARAAFCFAFIGASTPAQEGRAKQPGLRIQILLRISPPQF
jgi:hypothetical protein